MRKFWVLPDRPATHTAVGNWSTPFPGAEPGVTTVAASAAVDALPGPKDFADGLGEVFFAAASGASRALNRDWSVADQSGAGEDKTEDKSEGLTRGSPGLRRAHQPCQKIGFRQSDQTLRPKPLPENLPIVFPGRRRLDERGLEEGPVNILSRRVVASWRMAT